VLIVTTLPLCGSGDVSACFGREGDLAALEVSVEGGSGPLDIRGVGQGAELGDALGDNVSRRMVSRPNLTLDRSAFRAEGAELAARRERCLRQWRVPGP
jgi:hypothetical protein